MAHLIIGVLLTVIFVLLILHARKKHSRINFWQWILTILWLVYAGFVLEVIVSFLEEGAERAALVMGLILGFVAIVWAVLLGRFVFARKTKS
jgi:Mn2+/Fe2+ NRAMP family transporter